MEPTSALAHEPNCSIEQAVVAAGGTDREIGPIRRAVLFALGTIMLGLGILGIILPLLPTTCFLLGAAACYGRSSTRFYNWMYSNRLFGEYLRGYRDERALPARIKYGSLTVLWVTIGVSAAIFVDILWVRLLLAGIALAVTLHIVSLKTMARGSSTP